MQRSVLITGCSTGIGAATADLLQLSGYRVIASVRDERDRMKLLPRHRCVRLDLSNSRLIDHAWGEVMSMADGRLFAVIHNAGYGQAGALEDLPVSALRDQFETNFFGIHDINCRAIKAMRPHGEGRILLNSSVLGYSAFKYRGAYAASKFALEAMADTLRLELRGTGIHTSLIQPGPIATNFRKNSLRAFLRHVDHKESFHKEHYPALLKRLTAEQSSNRYTLPADAVAQVFLRCLQSSQPSPRYQVTRPAQLMWWLKRYLPTTWFDAVCERVV